MSRNRTNLVPVRDAIVEGYRNGATLRDLARVYASSPSTIRILLLKTGEVLRRKGRRKVNAS